MKASWAEEAGGGRASFPSPGSGIAARVEAASRISSLRSAWQMDV